jgi:hypothetical protein
MKILATIMAILLLSACATPTIVAREQLNDSNKSCDVLQMEIAECDKSLAEVAKEKGVTGTNVAALVFFWPALIATHVNVNDATKALNERKSHLVSLYEAKKCSARTQGK